MSQSSQFGLSEGDRIIVVMGPTGSGKSTFINDATGQTGQTIGHGLRSCTADIRPVRVSHPSDGHPVIFVDTPGFDDTYKPDMDILSMIADWLVETYKGNVNLAIILYLHRISDNRMTGSVMKNLRIFASLCGQQAMPHVILATTMWGELKEEATGVQREEQLKAVFWKDMLADGSRTERYDHTRESAWRIVGSLVDRDHAPVLLPREMVDHELSLSETTAAKELVTGRLAAVNRPEEKASRFIGPFNRAAWDLYRGFFDISTTIALPVIPKRVDRVSQPSTHPQERFIIVMGPSGSGKSTFIDVAARKFGRNIGHDLWSSSTEIRSVKVLHPSDGYPVVFVDMPGFDDTFRSDTEILRMVADWFANAYKGNINIAGIIYMQRISDNRITTSTLQNLDVFISLCGQKAMPYVILATTMWGELADKNDGVEREEELKADLWNSMLADGCRTERFDNTYESAWHIVGSLESNDYAPVLLSREIVDIRLRLNETQAGITLNKKLERLIKDRQGATRRLGKLANKQGDAQSVQELNAIKAKIDEQIQQTSGQLRQLEISFTRRFVMFIKSWSY